MATDTDTKMQSILELKNEEQNKPASVTAKGGGGAFSGRMKMKKEPKHLNYWRRVLDNWQRSGAELVIKT